MSQQHATHSSADAAPASHAPAHLAHLFFQQTLAARSAPLLWAHDGKRMMPVARSTVSEWISLYARGLQARDIGRNARIALLGTPNTVRLKLLLAHALLGATTIALADDLPEADVVQLLEQSNARVLLVDDARSALPYLQAAAKLPELKLIISIHGALPVPHSNVEHCSLDALMAQGRATPDRTSQWLQTLQPDDAALLIGALPHHEQQTGRESIGPKADLTMKTHAELLQSCQRLHALLTHEKIHINPAQPIIVQSHFQHSTDFIACQILPVALGCSIDYLGMRMADTEHFHQLQPQLLIGHSAYITQLHQRLEQLLTAQADAVDRFTAATLLRLGKKRYERSGKLNAWEKLLFSITHQSVSNRVRNLLGNGLRAILSVDENLPYSTQLFFETFGIRVVEVPAVFDQRMEKIRL